MPGSPCDTATSPKTEARASWKMSSGSSSSVGSIQCLSARQAGGALPVAGLSLLRGLPVDVNAIAFQAQVRINSYREEDRAPTAIGGAVTAMLGAEQTKPSQAKPALITIAATPYRPSDSPKRADATSRSTLSPSSILVFLLPPSPSIQLGTHVSPSSPPSPPGRRSK